jgi:hypothetical protein
MSDTLTYLISTQQDFLKYISNPSYSQPISSTDITNAQTSLNTTADYYKDANTTIQYMLQKQDEMSHILNNEKTRLETKQGQIDNQIFGKERQLYLNDSYRKKQRHYILILIILVVTLIIFIGINQLKKIFPIIPDSIIDLLSILIIGISSVYIIVVIRQIVTKDNMNFDQIKFAPPNTTVSSAQKVQSANQASDLLSSLSNSCVGEACCSTNSAWNAGINKCVFDCSNESNGKILYDISNNRCTDISGCINNMQRCGNACIPITQRCNESFTTLDNHLSSLVATNINNGVVGFGSVKPYGPFEFENYSRA